MCCLSLPWGPDRLVPVFAIASKLLAQSALGGLHVYAGEIFATPVRGSSIGLCAFAARIGSILAPQAIFFLSPGRVALLFGFCALASAVACRALLPETQAVEP